MPVVAAASGGTHVLLDLGLILVLAVGCQALATKFRLPSIVLLLSAGLIVGPGLRWIDPTALIGDDLLLPSVSLAVGVILFEGGMLLDVREINAGVGRVVWRLLTLGVLVTWIAGLIAAMVFLGLPAGVAAVLAAILTVSGPTVVLPLLAFIRPTGNVETVLKWEGIFIDAVGATLAVIVFEAVVVGQPAPSLWIAALRVLATLATGAAIGAAGSALLIVVLRYGKFSTTIEPAITLAFVAGTFVLADAARLEAGLLATTVMGIVIANQRLVETRAITEFKETLSPLLTGLLFVVLSARLTRADLSTIGFGAVGFVAAHMLIIRPLTVMVSTWGSELARRERAMIAWMAPRGIVAAATASVFGQQLARRGFAGTEQVAPVAFALIFATAVIYGLSGPFVAGRLKVRQMRLGPAPLAERPKRKPPRRRETAH